MKHSVQTLKVKELWEGSEDFDSRFVLLLDILNTLNVLAAIYEIYLVW